MANNNDIKHVDDEVIILGRPGIALQFAKRDKTVMGTYTTGEGGHKSKVVFWGTNNNKPAEREALISGNNIVPQIIRTQRNIIIGGGLMAYKEIFKDDERIIREVAMPNEFADFLERNEEEYGGLVELCNDLLIQGQYYIEGGILGNKKPAYLIPHPARTVRAQQQDSRGKIPRYLLHGGWGGIHSQQKLSEAKGIKSIPSYDIASPSAQPKWMYQGADRLLGGPYYYDPHYEGSTNWIKTANQIPLFHLNNIENGYNIRYIIKIPEDYFLKSLAQSKRKDAAKVKDHLREQKQKFKDSLNKFLAGAENAGRGLILTKHIYRHLQKEWPEIEIEALEVDFKDESMLKLYESSNQASTSAHGIPPVLAGLATGAKMTSGSEIRKLYNFWQISATTMPRKILIRPYTWAWRQFGLDRKIKLGFRNIELTTTDKNPSGTQESNQNTI